MCWGSSKLAPQGGRSVNMARGILYLAWMGLNWPKRIPHREHRNSGYQGNLPNKEWTCVKVYVGPVVYVVQWKADFKL
jgi:hypothetical protein